FSLEAMTGDDANGVSLRGLRFGFGGSEDDEFGTSGLFWGAYQQGEDLTVTSAGLDASLFSLPLGPIRLTPQFRLGGEYRSDPPDDGLAGLAGIGFEVGFWLGRSLQV